MSAFTYNPPINNPDARTKCIDCQASIPAKYTRCWNCWGKQPSEKIKSLYKKPELTGGEHEQKL